MMKYIVDEFNAGIELRNKILNDEKIMMQIEKASNKLVEAYKNGYKALFAGNGGSAADAQHFAAEMISKFYFERKALPGIALTTDSSIITAIGNDYGFEKLFVRQLEGNARRGDVFLALTTSGNSKNICEALKYARENGIFTICLNGKNGGVIEKEGLADIDIIIPSELTPRIQEVHTLLGHIFCAIVEMKMFKLEE